MAERKQPIQYNTFGLSYKMKTDPLTFLGLRNNDSIRACWIWDDYSQLSATRLVGYLSSHKYVNYDSPEKDCLW